MSKYGLNYDGNNNGNITTAEGLEIRLTSDAVETSRAISHNPENLHEWQASGIGSDGNRYNVYWMHPALEGDDLPEHLDWDNVDRHEIAE